MIPLRDDQEQRVFPLVTFLLIALNAYVFIAWQLRIGVEESVDYAGFLPLELTSRIRGGWVHVFTAMFMHGSWLHLLGNMWFLWVFGGAIENACGHFRYLVFYLLCGVVATLAFTAIAPHSEVPLVGASGAISGVLGAYFLHHPTARVLTLVPIWFFFRLIELPAWFFLLFWIGLQILAQFRDSAAHGVESGGVAYAAHIGGFLAGMILIVLFEKWRDTPRSRA
jgi:membrane associated rhomboid family serine protease